MCNIYATLGSVISKSVVYSCAKDRASLLLCLPLPANKQEHPRLAVGSRELLVSVAIRQFPLFPGLGILEHPSLPGPLGWLPLGRLGCLPNPAFCFRPSRVFDSTSTGVLLKTREASPHGYHYLPREHWGLQESQLNRVSGSGDEQTVTRVLGVHLWLAFGGY